MSAEIHLVDDDKCFSVTMKGSDRLLLGMLHEALINVEKQIAEKANTREEQEKTK